MAESSGLVSYTHAGGIDRPLAIWKAEVGTIVTHQNWRGQFARGTFGVDQQGPTKVPGQSSDCPSYPPSNGCVPVRWPGWNTTAWHEGIGSPSTTGYEHYWMGSLATGMRDASGQMYMRNRYYDPQTGQFTQPDPMGLAGGLNSYGFAAGDPVSYSDPYGLCPPTLCAGVLGALGGAGLRVAVNALTDRPLSEGVVESAVGGFIIRASFGAAAPEATTAFFARAGVDFGQVVGQFIDQSTGAAAATTKGIIHYSASGAHIVPARP